MGLRELKKERTRQLIAGTAWQLFTERGFEQVSVAEVARRAQVSEATVFNYFPNKEDLFYSRLEDFGARLADAVAVRPPGEPALAAFRRALLAEGGLLAQASADPEALGRLRTASKVISASPALMAREQQAIRANAAALAAVLAAQTGAAADDPRPRIAADALTAVHHALVDHVRRRIVEGEQDTPGLAAEVRSLAGAAFELLDHGLGDYAPGLREQPAKES